MPRPHHSLSVRPQMRCESPHSSTGYFLSTWSQLHSSEKRDPQMRNYLHCIGLWPCLWALSWETINMEEPSLLWAVPPEHTILSCTKRKLAEQAVGRKPVRSTSLWFLLLGFCLSSWPGFEASVIVCDLAIIRWNKPFPLHIGFDHCAY